MISKRSMSEEKEDDDNNKENDCTPAAAATHSGLQCGAVEAVGRMPSLTPAFVVLF